MTAPLSSVDQAGRKAALFRFLPQHNLGLRWRKALRDLVSDRLRTLLVILSMAAGIFAFGAIIGARSIAIRELNHSFLGIRPASILITTEPFSPELVEAARRWPGVAYANGRREIPVRVLVGADEHEDLRLLILDDYQNLQVNIAEPERGPWPPPRRQILLERKSLPLFNKEIGEELLLELPDGRLRSIPIAGVAHDMNQPPAHIFGTGFGYITPATAVWLGLPSDLNQLQIRVSGDTTDTDHLDAVAASAERHIQASGRQILRNEIPKPDSHFFFDFMPAIIYLLSALGVLSLILSSLLIFNVLTAVLKKQVRQIGIMKAIGGRTGTIIFLYLRMVMVMGALASLVAVPASLIAAYYMATFIANELNFDLANPWVEPQIILLEITVALVVPIIVALVPIRSTARITVWEALADTGLSGDGFDGFFERLRLFQWLPRPVRLSLRNTVRQKARLALTLITLGLAGAVFLAVMTLRVSLFATLEETMLSRGYDLQINLKRLYRLETLSSELANRPAITAIEGWRVVNAVPRRPDGTDGEPLFLNGLPSDTQLYRPELGEGRWLAPTDDRAAVVHNNLLKKEPELALGDKVTLVIDGQETTWTIVGVTHELQPPIGPTQVYVTRTALSRALGGVNETDSLRISLENHDAAFQSAELERLERWLSRQQIDVRSSRTSAEDRALFTQRFNILTVVLGGMSAIIALVGTLGLTGTLSINVMERRREIGVLRAIGGSDRAILFIFVLEGLFIGLTSWFLAMILTQPLGFLLSYQLGLNFLGFPLDYIFSFGGAAAWLGIIFLLSIISSFLPARQAINLRIRDALAYE